jgi:NADPH2:quinone reductase
VQAVVVESLSGPSSAVLSDVPEPVGSHERARGRRLLVAVHAAGLSPIDALQSEGAYQYGTPPPYVAGSEVAGVVLEADDDTGFLVGQRVAGIVFWGAMAERCLLAPEYTVALPETMSFAEGVAVYLNYSTAWYAYHRAGVVQGQTVLVHGAAGGVGTAVLDLADRFGARVVAVVSTEEKARVARRYGAWAVVRADSDWLAQVRRLTDGHGVDAVLDPVGGDRFTDSLRALRIGGILVVIGFVGGTIPEVRVNRLLLRNLTVTGISMDTMEKERPGTLLMVRDAVQGLLDGGHVHPWVGERYPLRRGPEALARVAQGTVPGKIVVDVAP